MLAQRIIQTWGATYNQSNTANAILALIASDDCSFLSSEFQTLREKLIEERTK